MDEDRAVPTTPEATHALRRAGLRVTRPRTAVLAAVEAHPHAETDVIIDAVRVTSARSRTRRSTTS